MHKILLKIEQKNINLSLLHDNKLVLKKNWVDNNNILEIFFEELDNILKLNNLIIDDISKFELELKNPYGYTTTRIAQTLINSLNFKHMDRPKTTLFMLSSVDGKISTGNTTQRDTDLDYHRIYGILEGVEQYYELEQKTDLHSLNTGKVMAKIGVNEKFGDMSFMNFIIFDNTHLKKSGVKNLANNLKKLYLVTSNKNHPAFTCTNKNLEIIYYENKINFTELFEKFRQEYDIDKITIQSGGIMNSIFLREKLIDEISIVIAPALIGGKDTPTLIDGKTLETDEDLKHVKALELISVDKLKHSFLHLRYKVINETKIKNNC